MSGTGPVGGGGVGGWGVVKGGLPDRTSRGTAENS